jgi:hypothetical protein
MEDFKGKVKCVVCAYENASFCRLKPNSKVKVNKSRACKDFIFAPEKVNVRPKVQTSMRPDDYWTRKKTVSKLKKALSKQSDRMADRVATPAVSLDAPDCLAQFRSTVTE